MREERRLNSSCPSLQFLEQVLAQWQLADTVRSLQGDMAAEDAAAMTAWLQRHRGVTLKPSAEVQTLEVMCSLALWNERSFFIV